MTDPNIATEGGSVVSGNIQANEFVGRDKVVNNYYRSSVDFVVPQNFDWTVEGFYALTTKHIESKRYSEAIKVLNHILNQSVDDSDLYLLRAIASLKGENPNHWSLSPEKIKNIEQDLEKATRYIKTRTLALIVSTVIKQDRYVANGLSDEPSAKELARIFKSEIKTLTEEHKKLLNHVVAEPDTKQLLGISW